MMNGIVIKAYKHLPFSIAVAIAYGKPNLAFHIPPGRRNVNVDNYLGQFKVRLDTHSDIERRMLSRKYELSTLSVIERLVTRGQHAFDVGANVGAVTFALAKAVGVEGRVDAFEPGPPIVEKLLYNIRLNPVISQVMIHQLGLSDQKGELLWQESQTDSGNATIHWADASLPTLPVRVTTIDEFFKSNDLSLLHFVKIDVEGMELRVLRGGLETINQQRPAIYFESSLCDDEQKAAVQAIEWLLSELGYKLYKVRPDGVILETQYPNLSFETLALTSKHLPLLERGRNA